MLAARTPLETGIGRPRGGRLTLDALRARPVRWLAAPLAAVLLAVALLAALRAGGHSVAPAASPARTSWGLSGLPLAARGPASEALARGAAAYRVVGSSDGYRAGNPAQRLSERFTPAAVRVGSRGIQVGLSLRAAGHGANLHELPAAAPRASANRVLYRRGAVSEWYANGPLGLEQGFTIASLPGGGGPLTLALAVSGNARASLSSAGAQSIVFSHAGAPVLRYGGLLATDARGRALHSWLTLAGRQIRLHVDARGARFPVRIDPWVEQALLSAGYGDGGGLFGYSIALSSDGNTALIGGPREHNHVGAAWVFVRTGETWYQQGPKLTGAEETGEEGGEEGEEGAEEGFGASVALAADGNTALIGAPRESGKAGAAWVFLRSGETWSRQGQLTPVGETGLGRFGRSVALSADASTALIGGSADSSGHGAAWVFSRAGQGWSQQARLTGGEREGEAHFGRSTALSADGGTALIGGPGDAHYTGAAWVFSRASGSWSQLGAKLTGGGEAGEAHFGRSVALSADGTSALVGGFGDNERAGAAWAFAREGQAWAQQGAKLTGSGGVGEGLFGVSVSLSGDGNTALIGGYGGSGHVGAAWAFTRSGSGWSQQGERIDAPAFAGIGWFGLSVALSGDAATGMIGAPVQQAKSGGAWVFQNTAFYRPPVNTSPPVISGSVQAGQPLGCSPGSWTGTPPPTFAFEWQRDGAKIAEGPTYVVQGSDEGHTLTCVVRATNAVSPGEGVVAASSGLSVPGGAPNPPGKAPGSGSTTGSIGVLAFKGRPPALPAPIFGQTANLLPTAGLVLIKLPGSNRFVPLSSGKSVPLGTVVDATRGQVQLISAADVSSQTDQSGIFYGGVFRIGQIAGPSSVQGGKTVAITVLTLAGAPPSGCKAKRVRRATVAAKRRTRKLWGNAKGNFTSSGRYASATVRGTQWLTEDTCAGTLVRVVSGVVSVSDFPHHRSFLLKAGKQFLSHPGKGG